MSAAGPVEPTSEIQRNARYGHLVGRLRSREITMEEATELFTLMQAMLRNSEIARVAALRMSSGSVAAPPPPAGRIPSGPTAAAAASDDMFLASLLAMGAGAGLLAAMAKRLSSPPPTP